MEDKPSYYEKNKDKIKKQVRENYFKKLPEKRDYYLSYYKKNKERIAEKNKSKVKCEKCNNIYAFQYIKKHVCLAEGIVELKEVVLNFD